MNIHHLELFYYVARHGGISEAVRTMPYVANGYGIGLSVGVPQGKLSPKVRMIALPDFSPLTLGALWQGKLTPLTQAFLSELQDRAKQMAGAMA
ncbi:MAG TPA: hypothetical protein VGK40_08620 [Verrucomicrobiae bacterium]|jgi:DNA-binding transcriptional LysR family regulator